MCSWPEMELWVASSDTDADVFVYLEDYDPAADRARYVTEGHFRASHRREYPVPPAGDPRAAAHVPGGQVPHARLSSGLDAQMKWHGQRAGDATLACGLHLCKAERLHNGIINPVLLQACRSVPTAGRTFSR